MVPRAIWTEMFSSATRLPADDPQILNVDGRFHAAAE
jgi:hypothetical protein